MNTNKIFNTPSVPSTYLQSLFNESNFPVIKFAQNLDIFYYNSAASDYFQELRKILITSKEEIATPLINIKSFLFIGLPQNMIQQIRNTCEKLLNLNQDQSPSALNPINILISCPNMSPNNPGIPMQISLLPSSTQSTFEFLGIISCTTEIIKLRTQLDRKSVKLHSIYQAAPLGIGVAENRIITSVNPYFLKLLGYTEEEVINHDAIDLYPSKEEYDRVGRVKHPQILEHGVGSIETQFVNKQGKLVDIFLSSAARRDRDISTGVVFTALDISAKKKAERALKESRQMLTTVLDTIPTLIFWKNTDSVYLGCNQAFVSHIGIDRPEDVLGKTDFDFFPEGLANKYRVDDQHIIHTKKSRMNYVEPMINSQGEFRWCRISKVPLYNSDGDLIGLIGAFDDVTDIREVEHKMAKIQEQLTQTQKMESIGRLAGGIAHEFNNILTTILGYADILKVKYPDPESLPHKSATVITQTTERGSNLTKKLLGFARVGNYNPQPLNINQEITKITNMTQNLFPKTINVLLRLHSEPLIVDVDQTQFELAITNLLINARDALINGGTIAIDSSFLTPESANWDYISSFFQEKSLNKSSTQIFFQTPSKISSKSPSRPYSQYVQIRIRDTGIGMPESVKSHIFEPYFTTKDKNKGTGLGLPMVYGIITNHDGFIKVDSSPNKGTTFTIFLPRSLNKEDIIQKPEDSVSTSEGGTILVVDDEENIQEFLTLQLTHLGYQVITASDGEQAINIYQNHKSQIKAVLLDLVMPVMDGSACFTRLRQLDPKVKIILISGYSHMDEVKNMIKLGVNGFLQKPFNLSDLTSALSNLLDSPT